MRPVGAVSLPVTERDRAALDWLERRAGERVVVLRCRRKRLPRGPLSPRRVEVLRALTEAVRRLREVVWALTRGRGCECADPRDPFSCNGIVVVHPEGLEPPTF